jgi:plastocyanin
MNGQSARRRRFAAPLAVVVLSLGMVIAVVACGEDEEAPPALGTPAPAPADDGTPAPTPTPTPTPEPADEATPTPEPDDDGPEVRSSSIASFALESLTISVGDSVRWTNNDDAPHTATHVDGDWDTGTLNQGESATLEFTEAGTFEYFCAIHPQMTATLTVEE